MGEVEPAQAFLHFQPGLFRMPRGASAAHALFTQRGTIHLTPYGPKTESEQSSRVTLVDVTPAVGWAWSTDPAQATAGENMQHHNEHYRQMDMGKEPFGDHRGKRPACSRHWGAERQSDSRMKNTG